MWVESDRAGERANGTSERGYCRIISVGRAIARSYWYYPQYPVLFALGK